MKLIDMDAVATLDGLGFMGAKFSSGVLPPEMFEVLNGDGVDKFTSHWHMECSQQTELWRKIEPRWSRSGDAIVVKTWCVYSPLLCKTCRNLFSLSHLLTTLILQARTFAQSLQRAHS